MFLLNFLSFLTLRQKPRTVPKSCPMKRESNLWPTYDGYQMLHISCRIPFEIFENCCHRPTPMHKTLVEIIFLFWFSSKFAQPQILPEWNEPYLKCCWFWTKSFVFPDVLLSGVGKWRNLLCWNCKQKLNLASQPAPKWKFQNTQGISLWSTAFLPLVYNYQNMYVLVIFIYFPHSIDRIYTTHSHNMKI